MKVCACAVITVEGGLAGGERGESSVLREREIEREGDIERQTLHEEGAEELVGCHGFDFRAQVHKPPHHQGCSSES